MAGHRGIAPLSRDEPSQMLRIDDERHPERSPRDGEVCAELDPADPSAGHGAVLGFEAAFPSPIAVRVRKGEPQLVRLMPRQAQGALVEDLAQGRVDAQAVRSEVYHRSIYRHRISISPRMSADVCATSARGEEERIFPPPSSLAEPVSNRKDEKLSITLALLGIFF